LVNSTSHFIGAAFTVKRSSIGDRQDQLDPEQSTSAIVVHHPQAKYFSV
jgi:hypothetical protein